MFIKTCLIILILFEIANISLGLFVVWLIFKSIRKSNEENGLRNQIIDNVLVKLDKKRKEHELSELEKDEDGLVGDFPSPTLEELGWYTGVEINE